MQVLTNNDIKLHSRVNLTTDELNELGDTAEEYVQQIIERTFQDLIDEFGKVPAPVKHACLMMVDHLYQYRGIVNQVQMYKIPCSVDSMLKPYIRF